MKSVPVALVLVALAAPAFAALDDDPPPAPAPGTETKPAAKRERKVDPAALKALERYTNAVHLPASSGMKTVSAKGELDLGGVLVEVHPKWTVETGFGFDLEVPAAARETLVSQGVPDESVVDLVRSNVGQTIGFAGINALFDAPGRNWEHYDLSLTQSGEDEIVNLTPIDDKADADSRRYVFGKDGLLKAISVDPRAAEDDENMQHIKATGGFESTVRYEKKGDRSVISGRTLKLAGVKVETTLSYHSADSGFWLAKDAKVSTPDGDLTFTFHDYVVDGKLVESTRAPAPKAAEPVAPKAPEKPAETPPAPTPKDEPK